MYLLSFLACINYTSELPVRNFPVQGALLEQLPANNLSYLCSPLLLLLLASGCDCFVACVACVTW